MKYQEIKNLIEAEDRNTAFYASRCMWWTSTRKDLGQLPDDDLPCCPFCASVLFEAPLDKFLASAEENPDHYGPGGLETFAAAHHGSGLHSSESWTTLKPMPIRFPRKPRVLSTEKSIRCTRCATEFSEADIEGANGCPKCGAKGVPMLIKNDVTIRVNWHELRILGIWADNWAGACDEREPEGGDAKLTVAAILRRIQAQHPERDPLTLLGELQQLQESYPEMEATDHRGVKIITPKKPN